MESRPGIAVGQSAPVVARGSGRCVLAIHGGPGFSHRYLAEGLATLALYRRLILFDQPGCGSDAAAPAEWSLASAGTRLLAVRRGIGCAASFDVVAHSWGGLVLLEALRQDPGLATAIGRTVFVNPVPIERGNYDRMRSAFVRRLPAETISAFEAELVGERDGTRLMSLLLPYYSPGPVPIAEQLALRLETYLAYNSRLGPFDYSTELSMLNHRSFILGGRDFCRAEFMPFLRHEQHVTTILGVGHFLFHEAPAIVDRLLRACLVD